MELEVKLSKNSWHYKLQKFVFKEDTPDLHSLCPYFWLTIFCLPASIFVMIYRPIKWFVKYVKASIDKAEEERVKKLFQNLTVDGAIDLIKSKKKIDGRKYKGYYDIWNLVRSWQWRKGFSDEQADKYHDELVKKFSVYEQGLRESLERSKVKKEEVKQKLQVGKIVKYTKLFAGIIISLFVVFLLYIGIKALINASWTTIGVKLLHLLILLVAVGIIAGVLVFLSKSFTNVEEYYKNDDNLKWYGYPLYILYNLIKWPLKGLWSVISFFFSYFSAAKDNYCPGIIWEDSEKVNK